MYLLGIVKNVFQRESLGPMDSFTPGDCFQILGMEVLFLPAHATLSAILDLRTSKTGAASE